jgi:hypothetical protein
MMRLLMFCFLFYVCVGCNGPDAPWCLMRPGQDATITSSWEGRDLKQLVVYDHVDVTWKHQEGEGVSITWKGPENLLAHAQTEWEGDVLIVGHEDRCQWTRQLDLVVKLEVASPILRQLELRGQGQFTMEPMVGQTSFRVDAYASSSVVQIEAFVDTLAVKLHVGPTEAIVIGEVQVFEGYSSGLGQLDASECLAKEAFINQSGLLPLSFVAQDYAYVAINSPGNAMGFGGAPAEVVLETISTGVLIWE